LTRCDCEKNRPKCSQTQFSQKQYTTFTVIISGQYMCHKMIGHRQQFFLNLCATLFKKKVFESHFLLSNRVAS
jgi:hypothetical protein